MMNANEASKISSAQLEPDSDLIKPYLQPVFNQLVKLEEPMQRTD